MALAYWSVNFKGLKKPYVKKDKPLKSGGDAHFKEAKRPP